MRWRHTSAIGLELDGPCVRAVQVSLGRRGWRVRACAEVVLPDDIGPDQRGMVARGILDRQGFTGRRVHVGVPEGTASLDLLERPSVADAVRAPFARALRCHEQALELCLWQTAALPGRSFAAALPHTAALDLIRPLELAGLDVAGVFCPMAALAALVPQEPYPLGILRCGMAANTLTLIDGADVLYHRSLDTPGGLAADQHAPLAALSEELATTLACVPRSFGGLQIVRVLASGEPAETEDGLSAINQRLGTAEALVPTGALPDSLPESALPASRFDVALGLALLEEDA